MNNLFSFLNLKVLVVLLLVPLSFSFVSSLPDDYGNVIDFVYPKTEVFLNLTLNGTDWNNITNIPAGFADDVDNDTTYSHLSNFTDDLGSRGYTHLSNFTNDLSINGSGNTTEEIQDSFGSSFNVTLVYDDSNNESGVNQTWLSSIYAKITDLFSGSWNDLTDIPSGFSDNVDNDTTYSHLSNFTDDLGNRGYTSLSNFSNDPGYITSYSESDPLWTGNISNYFTIANILSFGYFNLTNNPLTHLSNFTDDLGDRGYTSISNFSNDQGFWNDTYASFNKSYADTLYHGFDNSTFTSNVTSLNDYFCNATSCYQLADFLLDTGGTETDPLWTDNSTLVAYLNDNVTFDNITSTGYLDIRDGSGNGWENVYSTIGGFLFSGLRGRSLSGVLNVGYVEYGLYLWAPDTVSNVSYLFFPDDTLANNAWISRDKNTNNLDVDKNGAKGNFNIKNFDLLATNDYLGVGFVNASEVCETDNDTCLSEVGLLQDAFYGYECSSGYFNGTYSNGTPICNVPGVAALQPAWVRMRDSDGNYIDADSSSDLFDFRGQDGINATISGDGLNISLATTGCGIPSAVIEQEDGSPTPGQMWSFGNGQGSTSGGVPLACDGTITSASVVCSGTPTSHSAGIRVGDDGNSTMVNQHTIVVPTTAWTSNSSTGLNIAVTAGQRVAMFTEASVGTEGACWSTINIDYE